MESLSSLPSQPLTVRQANALNSIDSVVSARPQFVDHMTEKDANVIGVIMIFNSGVVALAGYDLDESQWYQLFSESVEDEQLIDEQLDDVYDWFEMKYGSEGFGTVGTV